MSARWLLSFFFGTTIVLSGCAAAPRGPAPIASAEVLAAMGRPREHPDAPLVVRDTRGQPYALSLDETVTAPTPPDGQQRVTEVRALLRGCEDEGQVCWLRRNFVLTPVGSPSS